MKYINKKTGAIIDVKSKIAGKNWEPYSVSVKDEKSKVQEESGTVEDKTVEAETKTEEKVTKIRSNRKK